MNILCFLVIFALIPSGDNIWTSYFTNNQVDIYYRTIDCSDDVNDIHQQKIILKFINKTEKIIKISFSRNCAYINKLGKHTSRSDKKVFEIILQQNESIEGSCDTKDKTLYIFSTFLKQTESKLIKFDLENILIKEIN